MIIVGRRVGANKSVHTRVAEKRPSREGLQKKSTRHEKDVVSTRGAAARSPGGGGAGGGGGPSRDPRILEVGTFSLLKAVQRVDANLITLLNPLQQKKAALPRGAYAQSFARQWRR